MLKHYHFTDRPNNFRINREHPLYNQLVFANFGKQSSGYLDETKYKNNGTLTGFTGAGNAPANAFSRALGRNILNFNGSSDYVSCSAIPSATATGTIICCAWINTTTIATGTMSIMSNAASDGNTSGFQVEINRTGGNLSWKWLSGSIGTSTNSITANTWNHLAWARAGSSGAWTYQFWINGIKDPGSGSSATNPSNTGLPLVIGQAGAAASNYFSGLLADPLILGGTITPDYIIPYLANPSNVMLEVAGTSLILPPRRRLFTAGNQTTSGSTTTQKRSASKIGSRIGSRQIMG